MRGLTGFIYLAFALAFAGCGTNDTSLLHRVVVGPDLDPEEVTLTCGSAKDYCNGSVGLVFRMEEVQGESSMYRCTASLVGKDLILTNAHCLPEASKFIGAQLSRVYFRQVGSETSGNTGLHQVVEVLSVNSDENPYAPDYAVLRLKDPVAAPIISIDQSGIASQQKLHLIGVNHWSTENHLEGPDTAYILDIYPDCEELELALFYPFEHNRHHYSTAFQNCPVRGGNSGGPLIDPTNGKLKGIIHARFEAEEVVPTFVLPS